MRRKQTERRWALAERSPNVALVMKLERIAVVAAGRHPRAARRRMPDSGHVSTRGARRGWGEWVERFADNGERAPSRATP